MIYFAELDDEAIDNLLEDSDIGDFISSDDGYDDPDLYDQRPDVSTSFIQARGRTRRGPRGVSRGRSRGRSLRVRPYT